MRRSPVFQQQVVNFEISDTTLATDVHGRIWLAVGGQPKIAVLDPTTGQVRMFTYAAPSMAAHPPHTHLGVQTGSSAPDAVWLVPIVAMATDDQGHLWYIREGYPTIEEVSA